jgi:parallel beta-helix repeat protein
MQNRLSSKWLWIAVVACCLIVAAYLGLWHSSEVCAEEPDSMPTPTHFIYLPFMLRSHAFQHREGNWVITGTEVVQNIDVLLDGNLIVQSGGSLILRYARLTLNGTYDGQYGILVQAGGAITVEARSVITAADAAGHFSFVAEEGSQFVMQDSALHGCGWGTEITDPLGPAEPYPISWDVTGLYIGSDQALVEANTFSSNFGALVLAGVGITVQGNTIASNEYNPVVVLGSGNTIRDNRIHHVPLSGWSRCLELYGNQNSVTDNTFSSEPGISAVASGIALYQSWYNTIANNTFYDLTGYGIMMGVGQNVACSNVITGNTISCGEFGINIRGRNNLVEGNTIGLAETGIEVMYSYENVIAANTLAQIGGTWGIRLTHASGNTIVNNRISQVDSEGILMWDSSQDNLLQGNVITSTYRGLAIFYDCDNNVIRDNVISNTADTVILMDDVSSNVVYRNNFIGGGMPPYDNGTNRWDQDGQGNYWSDYVGTDLDSDGVGDQPYHIAPGGTDSYPLMQPVTPQAGAVIAPPAIPFQEPLDFITITGQEKWEHQILTLETQITIQEGGSLTLQDVTMTFGSETHTAFIWVRPGGELYIYNSRIAEMERGYGGRLVIEDGATFVMQDSHLRGIHYSWWNEGFEIYGGGAILSGNVITGVSISLVDVSSATIVSNTIAHSLAPVWVNSGEHITVTDNEFLGSILWAVNIGGQESHDNLIANNTFSDAWNGAISLYEGTATVSANEVRESRHGVMVFSNGNEVVANDLVDTVEAISLVECSNTQVLSNTISSSARGIELHNSSENTIADNRIQTVTDTSLRLDNASHSNTVVSNTTTSSERGAFLDSDSWGNVLHHNNFLSNTIQAEDFGDNQWDDGQQGNYWSDYLGTDADSDGIGDTPYIIPPNGVDHYPLMALSESAHSPARHTQRLTIPCQ